MLQFNPLFFQVKRGSLDRHNESNRALHENLLLTVVKNLSKEQTENLQTSKSLQDDNLELQRTLQNEISKVSKISERYDQLEKQYSGLIKNLEGHSEQINNNLAGFPNRFEKITFTSGQRKADQDMRVRLERVERERESNPSHAVGIGLEKICKIYIIPRKSLRYGRQIKKNKKHYYILERLEIQITKHTIPP